MLLEDLFGSTFGIVWLIIFTVAVLGLLIWFFVKKDGDKLEKDNVKERENNEVSEKVSQKKENNESEIIEPSRAYEIIEGSDGFYRVRKVGTERTLRKLATRKEAEDYIKGRSVND